MKWQPFATIPDNNEQVLVGFMGQFQWFSFVVYANGRDTSYAGYGEPTHWVEIIAPKE